MDAFTPLSALVGGALIGLSATLLMAGIGRIAGISGIVGAVVRRDASWQLWFLGGMLLGGGAWLWLVPLAFTPRSDFPLPLVALAGALVGYGTRLGSGCTSGHGVCGLARLSPRSIAATAIFLGTGIVTTWVTRHLLGIGGLG
jgi:uncharacterized membrane protein YedE/YeeE